MSEASPSGSYSRGSENTSGSQDSPRSDFESASEVPDSPRSEADSGHSGYTEWDDESADSPRNDPVEERHKALERSQELTEPSTALNTSYDHEDDASEASYESDFEQSPAHAGDAVGSYVEAVVLRGCQARWKAPAAEDDEIAAMIAMARAARERPAAASTSAMTWDEKEMEAIAPSPSRQAVNYGTVGSPPPDDAQPGWLRDSSVQCESVSEEPGGEVFGPAYAPSFATAVEVASSGMQTDIESLGLGMRGASFCSLSGRLETVDEGREETPPSPTSAPTAPLPPRRRGRSRSPPRSLSPVEPLRALLPHEQEALYSGLSQAPSGTLAFGRRLEGRRPPPEGAIAWSDELTDGILAPIPAGHLHRICDPFAKRARPVWVVRTPRSGRHVLPPLPKGSESRPPEALAPDVRSEVHDIMAQRRAKDWQMAESVRLRHTAMEQDFRKRGVAAGAVYYAKPSRFCLQSLGAGGNFPGGRR